MDIHLDEKKWLMSMLEKNELGSRPVHTLTIYARYLKNAGADNADIRGRLEELLVRCDPKVNLLHWERKIDYAIKRSSDRRLAEINEVVITRSEIDTIKSVSGIQRQRILFVIICLAKYYRDAFDRHGCWVNVNTGEIRKMSNVSVPNTYFGLMINDLVHAGLISKRKRLDSTSVQVHCINDDSEPEIHITDFRNLGFQYDNYLHGGFIECVECGILIRRCGTRQKYCKDCARLVNIRKTIQLQRGETA